MWVISYIFRLFLGVQYQYRGLEIFDARTRITKTVHQREKASSKWHPPNLQEIKKIEEKIKFQPAPVDLSGRIEIIKIMLV